jgi:hypothetical protein
VLIADAYIYFSKDAPFENSAEDPHEGSSGYKPFSVVVQSVGLVQALTGCFKGTSFEKPGVG